MIDVYREFSSSPDYLTQIWMSARAKRGTKKLDKKVRNALYDKLAYCAENGFQGSEGTIVVHEGNQVYRFGIQVSLFRWWGFFRGFPWEEFIILDWTMKSGQKRGRAGDAMALKIVRIRDSGLWQQVEQNQSNNK